MTDKAKICVLGVAGSPHVVTRAEALLKRGYDVRLLSPVPLVQPASVPTSWPDLPGCGVIRKLYLLWWTSIALLRQHADLYHAHYAAEVGTWLAWLLHRRPLAVSVMGGDVLFDEQGTLGPVGRWLTRRALLGADLVTVKSPDLAEVVARFGVRKDKIEVVIWGVDLETFRHDRQAGRAFRDELGIADNQAVVFSPRIMAPFYNIHLLIEAWPRVIAAIPDAVLVISEFGGDVSYRKALDADIAKLGIDTSVIFAPARAPADMPGAYSGSDLIVSVPPSDGFPQAVLEAAACGCPVVLSDLERFHTLFRAGDEVLYTAVDATSIADTMTAALSDRDASSRRAAAASTVVAERADLRENVDRIERRFTQLMQAS